MTSKTDKELESQQKLLESCRKLSTELNCHGRVEPVHFPQETNLSLEQRLVLAMMTNPKPHIERLLKNGADLQHRLQNGLSVYEIGLAHRPELKDLLDLYAGTELSAKKKPKNSA